jgi:hypothetical protein
MGQRCELRHQHETSMICLKSSSFALIKPEIKHDLRESSTKSSNLLEIKHDFAATWWFVNELLRGNRLVKLGQRETFSLKKV